MNPYGPERAEPRCVLRTGAFPFPYSPLRDQTLMPNLRATPSP